MKKLVFQLLKRLFFLVLGLLILYLCLALILSIIPVNKNSNETKQSDIVIYLLSNGVHLDLVLPKSNQFKDWRDELQIDPFIEEKVNLVAFGWGDREFYLNTPTWSDLTFKTAFKALFLKDSAAMHVSYFRNLTEDKRCKKLYVSEEQYLSIVSFIENSLYHDRQGESIRIENAGYNYFDQFYEANGSYHLFFTCNTWTNRALKRSSLRACLWTPFDRGILWLYRKN